MKKQAVKNLRGTYPSKKLTKKHVAKKQTAKQSPKKKSATKGKPKKNDAKIARAQPISLTSLKTRNEIRKVRVSEKKFIKPTNSKSATVIQRSVRREPEGGARPVFTGRQLVSLNKDSPMKTLTHQARNMSLHFASINDFSTTAEGGRIHEGLSQADGVVFERLGIAVVNKEKHEEVGRLMAASVSAPNFTSASQERFLYACPRKPPAKKTISAGSFKDDAIATWGIHAVNTLGSALSGKGVNIAILDSGFTLQHPDFAGRAIVHKSFIKDIPMDDPYGHGTHCTGIAAGASSLSNKFRYGVAPEANIYIGKVLDDEGVGNDGILLEGIDWAINNDCRIVSLSMTGKVNAGDHYVPEIETAMRRALQSNCLVIAAAGNDSARKAVVWPVGHPANCPSVMAVAAITQKLGIADFSCAGAGPKGGHIDICAPGLDIISASNSNGYLTKSGTSMATPFVAGIAALLCEANPGISATELWMKLVQGAKRLRLSSVDGGAGMVFLR